MLARFTAQLRLTLIVLQVLRDGETSGRLHLTIKAVGAAVTEMRESVLAWDLIDDFRRYLSADELTAAFVGLGVGEYTAVIQAVVHAVERTGAALPPEAAVRVQAWRDCYRPTVADRSIATTS